MGGPTKLITERDTKVHIGVNSVYFRAGDNVFSWQYIYRNQHTEFLYFKAQAGVFSRTKNKEGRACQAASQRNLSLLCFSHHVHGCTCSWSINKWTWKHVSDNHMSDSSPKARFRQMNFFGNNTGHRDTGCVPLFNNYKNPLKCIYCCGESNASHTYYDNLVSIYIYTRGTRVLHAGGTDCCAMCSQVAAVYTPDSSSVSSMAVQCFAALLKY